MALMAAAPAGAAEFELALRGGKAVPPERRLTVLKGDAVLIRLTSDRAGEVHLHGYRIHARVAPGAPAEWRFSARATGRFRIEWHDEREREGGHHGPALAVLEVMPR
jgi:hypothetical protein